MVAEFQYSGAASETLLAALRAAGEATRLRLLTLTARADLTVTDLTQILGQSQPRVSRHLKLLCDSGLLERFREGTWIFYRLTRNGPNAALARTLADLIPTDDSLSGGDLVRLSAIKRARAEVAANYFRENAARWDQIRSLYVPETEVEGVLRRLLAAETGDLLDVGTGTGRMLELFGPMVRSAIGIDLSREMLAVARANLDWLGLRNCQVRHADMYSLPLAEASVDVVTYHQVLHFADDPAAAIAEGARVLRPDGLLVVVDFAPHDLERLREQHAHRRLGFADQEVSGWCEAVGLRKVEIAHLAGKPLTVTIWLARAPAAAVRRAAS
ncbi:MAG: metalloregulator ArsR/SmtB family transcription factor [Alphaproteobacteria bacterium]|nr:metalloregulator ArsR/SmtB family transcription factor [Alphaproteobacteria bacterium]